VYFDTQFTSFHKHAIPYELIKHAIPYELIKHNDNLPHIFGELQLLFTLYPFVSRKSLTSLEHLTMSECGDLLRFPINSKYQFSP